MFYIRVTEAANPITYHFVYSKTKDELYCIYWALFLIEEKRENLNLLLTLGYFG